MRIHTTRTWHARERIHARAQYNITTSVLSIYAYYTTLLPTKIYSSIKA